MARAHFSLVAGTQPGPSAAHAGVGHLIFFLLESRLNQLEACGFSLGMVGDDCSPTVPLSAGASLETLLTFSFSLFLHTWPHDIQPAGSLAVYDV